MARLVESLLKESERTELFSNLNVHVKYLLIRIV